MKKKVICCLVIGCLFLAGCKKTPASVSTSETSVSQKKEPEVITSVISNDITDEPVYLTDEEIKKWEPVFKDPENEGFLTCTYSEPKYVDINKVFTNGYPGREESFQCSGEEYSAYIEASDNDCLGSDLCKVTDEQINEFLSRKIGLTRNDVTTSFNYRDGWRYLDEFDAFYHVGDAMGVHEGYNLKFSIDSAMKIDSTDQLIYVFTISPEYLYEEGYRKIRREVALRVEGDNYMFESCRELIDEGLITEWCYDATLPYYGECKFLAYEPDCEDGDVTFRIIDDGEVKYTFFHNDNYVTGYRFAEIKDLCWDDFNNDACPDVMVILKYTDLNGAPSYDIRLYEGTLDGDFIDRGIKYEVDDYETADAGMIIAGLRYGDETWKSEMAAYIEQRDSEDRPMEGYSFIQLDFELPPQVVVVGDCEATGSAILMSTKDGIQDVNLNRLYFSYERYSGVLDNEEGLMGYYYDHIYGIENGRIELQAFGEYEVGYASDGTENINYSWNGVEVSEEEYNASLFAIYDKRYAVDGYDYYHLLSRQEILDLLNFKIVKMF